MTPQSRIYVAGHRGLVGSAIVRYLAGAGFRNVITRTHAECDLTDTAATRSLFATEQPEYVFLAAAKVGGILANSSRPAEFLETNLRIQTNVIAAAHEYAAKKLLFLGSSCIYPRDAPQPIREESLLTGALEPTNQWYAIAKIAGIKMVQAYRAQYGFNAISAMSSNLYGPGDNFDLESSHVLPALLRKFHAAKATGANEVVVWGDGTPRREFLHVDDLADALLLLMQSYDDAEVINVGCGADISIAELADLIRSTVGFTGSIAWDHDKPNGVPHKLLDVVRIRAMGWQPSIPLRAGVAQTYEWFKQQELLCA